MGVGMTRDVGVWVYACGGRAPIRRSGSEEVRRSDWHRRGVRGHKVDLLLVRVVARHVGQV